ncbi:uncharacterized protein LOC130896286 [Diorhabda carinulata]|uniref:uncharacterized protein LOC130896286 n=1 Tax=Diorhabda carinulata TaxID=1163345 RepID=UPI0025A1968A|nr:uncharacterized protein LOC130896286 [Diorhabda carinulata]
MHLYNDTQYFQYLVYPRFSIIRWIEFILCLVCLILAIMVFRSNVYILIKVVTISVSAAFAFICFFDVIAWLFRSPIGYAAWLMISLSAFLFFCLCGGCIFFLRRVTMVYYFYAMGFFFLATALAFLFDYIWMALEYINLRRCIPVPRSTSRLDRGVSTCCVCKYDIEPCPKRKPPENQTTTSERTARKIIYPSSNVVSNRSITPGSKKSHKCGVCPRKKQEHSAGSNTATSVSINQSTQVLVPRNKPRSPQTLPQMPMTTLDAEIQEEEYQLPFFKSDITDYPGPPYYLCNILEKRNIPSKYYSTLDTVVEKESAETSSKGEFSDMENGSGCSSARSKESSRSYQTSAASSIKKLFQSNAVVFDYQHTSPTEGAHEIKLFNEISEMGRNMQSLEIKRSVETIEIKRKVDTPELRRIKGSGDSNEDTHSYLYSSYKHEILPRKIEQTSQCNIEPVKNNLPSRIPIRPESRSALKVPTIVDKKPSSSPGFASRLRLRPETRVFPCTDNEKTRMELSTSQDRARLPWFKQEKYVSNRSPRNESSQKNEQCDMRLSRLKSPARFNFSPRKMGAESSDSFPSSGGDMGIGTIDKKCPTCHSLLKHSPQSSIEKKLSGISSTINSVDSERQVAFKTYMDGNCIHKTNLGTEGR